MAAFVSHNSKDQAVIRRRIVEPLEVHGIRTWYSQHDIRAASDWARDIVSALEASSSVIVALTQSSSASLWMRAEVDWAFQHRTGRIFPVRLEPCQVEEVHLLLRTVQLIDFVADEERGLQALRMALAAGFYRMANDVRRREERHSVNELDQRNAEWDVFSGRVSAASDQQRRSLQIRANRRALKRIGLTAADLKEQLRTLGFYQGRVDDEVDAALIDALTIFQKRRNLRHVDGVFGELTYLAMEEVARRRGLL
jgi:hypothetical protein